MDELDEWMTIIVRNFVLFDGVREWLFRLGGTTARGWFGYQVLIFMMGWRLMGCIFVYIIVWEGTYIFMIYDVKCVDLWRK